MICEVKWITEVLRIDPCTPDLILSREQKTLLMLVLWYHFLGNFV